MECSAHLDEISASFSVLKSPASMITAEGNLAVSSSTLASMQSNRRGQIDWFWRVINCTHEVRKTFVLHPKPENFKLLRVAGTLPNVYNKSVVHINSDAAPTAADTVSTKKFIIINAETVVRMLCFKMNFGNNCYVYAVTIKVSCQVFNCMQFRDGSSVENIQRWHVIVIFGSGASLAAAAEVEGCCGFETAGYLL